MEMNMTFEEQIERKQAIRREVRSRIKELSAEAREAAAREIFGRVESTEIFVSARCVAVFAAMRDEVPTSETLDRWLSVGKRVVVPRVEGEVMRFYDYSPEHMQSGAYGIAEPMGGDECNVADIDLIIVPARAFTVEGVRLGRGGGFYDKYMSLPGFRAHKIGIAFGCQIFDSLPTDKHDILVDEVIFS